MGSTVYRFSDLDFYLQSDGTFSHDVAEGDEVRDVADLSRVELEALYVGNTIARLGAGSEVLHIRGSDAGHQKVINLGSDLLEALGGEYVEKALKVKKAFEKYFGSGDPTDPMLATLTAHEAQLRAIQDFNLAQWVTNREEKMNALRALSSTALETAYDFVRSGRRTDDPVWAPRIAGADRDSRLAAHELTKSFGSGHWLRPYSEAALRASGPTEWMGWMPDRAEVDEFGRVWDYRWALPAAIYAITVRAAFLAACSPDTAAAKSELRRYNVDFLAPVFKRMEAGIRRTDRLTPTFNPAVTGVSIYAVDIHGGYNVGGSYLSMAPYPQLAWYPSPRPPKYLLPSGLDIHDVVTWTTIISGISRWWWNHVCITIGLPDVLAFAGRLENLSAPAPLSPHSKFAYAHQSKVSLAIDPERLQAAMLAAALDVVQPAETDGRRVLSVYEALITERGQAADLASKFEERLEHLGEVALRSRIGR